ncbi:MAG: ferritin-like domain-containing protein [Acidobacteriota bacterium]
MKQNNRAGDAGNPFSRRTLVKRIGIAGAAGAALLGLPRGLDAQTLTDVDIVNFALNLEYLEAEFYTVATTGKTIEQLGIGVDGTGTAGPTTGGSAVNAFDNTLFSNQVALQIAADERAHVTYLRNALKSMGQQPVAKPAINLGALGIGFANSMEFLTLARAFEDVGVTAYGGAAPLIQDTAVLGIAARIFAAENEHAANIRLQIAALGITTSALDKLDVLPPPAGMKFFSVDSSGLVQVRTPGQVLYIVYGNQADSAAGGFFPNGVNGTIRMSSAQA